MRLTLLLLAARKPPPTNSRSWPKPAFRRPMQGRYRDRKREPKSWETSMGELDEEEVNDIGLTVPVREKVPMIMVPNLEGFNLKPYVSYQVYKHHEPPVKSKDLFELFYAPQIQAEVSGTKLETVPNPKDMPSLIGRLRNAFTRTPKTKDEEGKSENT